MYIVIAADTPSVPSGDATADGTTTVTGNRGNNNVDAGSGNRGYGGTYWASNVIYTALTSSAGTAGHSTFGNLLYDDDEMAEKAAAADQWLYDHLFPGSQEWYLNEVCSSDIPSTGGSYAYVETDGQIQIVAHVEGEKIPYTMYNETNTSTGEVASIQRYIYKLSISVSNNDPENKTIRFYVKVDDVSLYNYTINLTHGSSFSKTGSSMEVIDSDNDYSTICIDFVGDAPLIGPRAELTELTDPLCNNIVTVDAASTSTYAAPSYLSITSSSSSSGTGANVGDGTGQTANAI